MLLWDVQVAYVVMVVVVIIIIIITTTASTITPFYFSAEHRAGVKVLHLVLFAAKPFISAHLFFSGLNSFSTVRRHLGLGRPAFPVDSIPVPL